MRTVCVMTFVFTVHETRPGPTQHGHILERDIKRLS